MAKLRINYIDENTSPVDLRKLFEKFGEVKEVSIHMGGFLVYAVITMPYEDALQAKRHTDRHRWRGCLLDVEWANRSRGHWLSPDWRPPKHSSWFN